MTSRIIAYILTQRIETNDSVVRMQHNVGLLTGFRDINPRDELRSDPRMHALSVNVHTVQWSLKIDGFSTTETTIRRSNSGKLRVRVMCL